MSINDVVLGFINLARNYDHIDNGSEVIESKLISHLSAPSFADFLGGICSGI